MLPLFSAFAFALGACIGSFLNVCIYRLPRELSVNEPRRSFCPHCRYSIPWYRNLPLFSWLQLRGKCGNCGAPIPFRYFGVELLTAVLFLAVWLHVGVEGWALAFPYWILTGLLVVATFIDFEFFIIPDEITWGGAVAGLVLSLAIPTLHGEEANLRGGLWGLVGAVAGYAVVRLVVEGGKLAFGQRRLTFAQSAELDWVRRGDEADLQVGEDSMLWSEFFARGHEQLFMDCTTLEVDGETVGATQAVWSLDWLHVGERKWQLEKTDRIRGQVTSVVLPREAMGLGDVKFMACIGAFLGWKAVLFTLVSASIVGALVGTLGLLLRRREWSGKLPFGPYLAGGAFVWLFAGPQILHWYWQFALAGK